MYDAQAPGDVLMWRTLQQPTMNREDFVLPERFHFRRLVHGKDHRIDVREDFPRCRPGSNT